MCHKDVPLSSDKQSKCWEHLFCCASNECFVAAAMRLTNWFAQQFVWRQYEKKKLKTGIFHFKEINWCFFRQEILPFVLNFILFYFVRIREYHSVRVAVTDSFVNLLDAGKENWSLSKKHLISSPHESIIVHSTNVLCYHFGWTTTS